MVILVRASCGPKGAGGGSDLWQGPFVDFTFKVHCLPKVMIYPLKSDHSSPKYDNFFGLKQWVWQNPRFFGSSLHSVSISPLTEGSSVKHTEKNPTTRMHVQLINLVDEKYLGNEKSYQRSAGVKKIRFICRFRLSENIWKLIQKQILKYISEEKKFLKEFPTRNVRFF